MTSHSNDGINEDRLVDNIRIMGQWADELGTSALRLRTIRKIYDKYLSDNDQRNAAMCGIIDNTFIVSDLPNVLATVVVIIEAAVQAIEQERKKLFSFSTAREYYEDLDA